MWIDSSILHWSSNKEATIVYGKDERKRAYEILAHAEGILANPATPLHLVDALTTMKRALDHRVRLLNDRYVFEKIPLAGKPKRSFEVFAYFGIMKPRMVSQLIQIRNKLEHEDAEPPALDRCQEFAELVWYFLRSTDSLIRERVDRFSLQPSFEDPLSKARRYELQISAEGGNGWEFELEGWLPSSMYSLTLYPQWFEIDAPFCRTVQELTDGSVDSPAFMDHIKQKRYELDDVHFQGLVKGPPDLLRRLYQMYFSIL
jgi:hypothetical protein